MNAHRSFSLRVVLFLLAPTAHAAPLGCTLPPLWLHAAASDGEQSDASASRRLLTQLVELATQERDSHSVSYEFPAATDPNVLVSAEAYAMAVRLRQLECAVQIGQVTDARSLYDAYLFDARELLGIANEGPRPSVDMRTLTFRPQAEPAPSSHDGYRANLHAGAALLGVGAGLAVVVATFAVYNAGYQEPQCPPNQLLCFSNLSYGVHRLLIGADVLLGLVDGAALITGTVLLFKGLGARSPSRLRPVASASTHGGSVGLELRF